MSTPMTRMIGHRTPDLATQVRHVQEQFPDLYDYLTQRDRALERTLARIPSRADIELSSVFNTRAYLEKALRGLAPGVGDLRDAVAAACLAAGESAPSRAAKRQLSANSEDVSGRVRRLRDMRGGACAAATKIVGALRM